jgi:hypothetical protein
VQRLAPLFAIGGFAAAVPVALMHFLARHEAHLSGELHFYGVGLTAVAATGAAIALTVVGARRGDARSVLVGTAFSVMAALLALHGLATPNLFIGPNGLTAVTGGATLPVGGAILALTALPSLRGPHGVRPLLWIQLGLLTSITAAGAIGWVYPSSLPRVPAVGSVPAYILLVGGLVFYSVLGYRALRTFLLTRRAADLLVAVGIVWLAAALVGALTLSYKELGWWLGHLFELVGIVFVGAPVAYDLHRSAMSRPLVGDLRGAELVAAEEQFLGSHVRALTVRLEQKDGSTEEHTRRVALRAVQVGEELGLSAVRLRQLAVGALLHDVGKLSVPDEVLKKPGPLTDEEFAVIRRHPQWGHRLLRELGGFSEGVHAVVLSHHERLDGCGYPNGLGGDDLDLDTRILTVCDVYDALISSRVYRPAWPHERAVAHLRENVGSAFDARCVAALERVLEGERALEAAA